MNAITAQYSVTDLVQRLNEAGVPCGPINTVKEAFENPQVKHLGMSVPVSHQTLGRSIWFAAPSICPTFHTPPS
jgi:crotonobetainyl-CoA:carnitine CoA-transferase CaiB-like acyl-CoA transferase